MNGERDTAMDDKKLLNGKFTFKSCVAKEASFTENVNRQLAESKEVGLPLLVT